MSGHTLRVALISDVFFDDGGGARLAARLREARRGGAELALLPELPLNAWCPIRTEPSAADAELPEGRRQRRMSEAARAADLWLLGGAIVRSPRSGRRYNTALLYDAAGELVGSYRKIHLPDEEGFRETRHFEPGSKAPAVLEVEGFPLGIQICSDVQRPQGTMLLAASGAEAILAPRCTEAATWPRWRAVLRASAITSASCILSVNRPRPEGEIALGGPSVAIGPDGEILAESTDPVVLVDLDRRDVRAARQAYPGYLSMRADLYAHGWSRLAAERGQTVPPS